MKRMIVYSLIIIVLATIVLTTVMVLPRMGKKPQGERLEKLSMSSNYRNGLFINPVHTIMERPPNEAFREMMKRGEKRTPSKPIETFPIDTERYTHENDELPLVTWLGHSSFLIRMNGVNLLIDPVFSKRASMSKWVGPKHFDYTHHFKLEELPKIDLILLSHDHYDHLDYELIRAIAGDAKHIFVPLGVDSHLEHWGVDAQKITVFDWWNEVNVEGITVTATPGRHFSGRKINDRFKTQWCGWAINDGKSNIFYSGDSGYYDGFKTIGEKLGPFDFAMIECGQYSRFWPNIHLMPEESVQVAIDVNAAKAMPMHWGKFRLSIHPWNEPPMRFVNEAKLKGVSYTVPQIGKAFTINNEFDNIWW
jgi:L-ascorbate metabolism protein UlaG (beta-lactamase superfamily)